MAPEPTAADARVAEILETFAAGDADPAVLLCDRHRAGATAFSVVEPDGSITDLSFGELGDRSRRFAGALQAMGVRRGDRVATVMGKSADLVVVLLGIWRVGAVYVPLFTAFAPAAIGSRLEDADVRVVVVDVDQRGKVPAGNWTVVVAAKNGSDVPEGASWLSRVIGEAQPLTAGAAIGGDGPIVHMFTSGTTGAPKGVVHPLRYVAGWQSYLEFGLGVRPDSVYWCGADPGWAYGLYSAVVGPLAMGMRSVLQRGGFEAQNVWSTMAALGITDYAAAPTVFRALRTSGTRIPTGLSLRRLSSAGEPLTPEVNEWARPELGVEVHDHYGQTELGMVLGFPHHPDLEIPIQPHTMGTALPGWSLAVLEHDGTTPAAVGEPGRLAIELARSPLMTFTGYVGDRGTAGRFTEDGRYYLTGDLAARSADGTFRFSSRDDDVIIMAGYRIGPYDVESVLTQHAAVAECAVVAGPDPVRGEVVEAFVVLSADAVAPADELERELQEFVRTRYAAHAYPRRVHMVPALPKTASGKVQRAELRRSLRAGGVGSAS